MISVIIPVGPNHTSYLSHALASLKGQEEISRVIIINDSGQPLAVPSIDGGMRGVAHARNLGASLATTPYLLFLDADDILLPDATGAMLAAMPGDNRAESYVYGDWYSNHGDGRIEYHPAREYSPAALLHSGVHVVTALLPTAKAQAIKFDESLAGWEDWDYWLQWLAAGWHGRRIKQPVLIYRQATGERREASYGHGIDLTESIRSKYTTLLEDTTMCAPCGSKRSQTMTRQNQDGPSIAPAGYALIEFVGRSTGARSFMSNGHPYRFGNNSLNKFRQVPLADVPGLLEYEELALVNTGAAGDPALALKAATATPEDEKGGLDESFFAQSPAERLAELDGGIRKSSGFEKLPPVNRDSSQDTDLTDEEIERQRKKAERKARAEQKAAELARAEEAAMDDGAFFL